MGKENGVGAQIVLGEGPLTIEQVWAIAERAGQARLSAAPELVARVARSARHVEDLLEKDGVIYGVTTGYGDSCTVDVPPEAIEDLPLQLTRFHGCGMGQMLSPA